MHKARLLVAILALGVAGTTPAAQQFSRMTGDPEHVRSWNRFADALYELHLQRLDGRRIRTDEQVGGYGGFTGPRDFYREVSYFDADTGELLSRIEWERDDPNTVHVIEVFVRDDQGRTERDYLAAFLPKYRNAPIQTLINLHNYNGDLHAFRQFDASGDRIYEQCQGRHFDEQVEIFLEDYELFTGSGDAARLMNTEAYLACFGDLAVEAGKYLDPLSDAPGGSSAGTSLAYSADADHDAVAIQIRDLGRRIEQAPDDPALYVERGNRYFLVHEFDRAIEDYSVALRLDDGLDEAWFGRGMARGRAGAIDEGIADLTVYIQRHPDSSLAYTKRGVRHIWNGDLDSAERDLSRAVELEPGNAEAHDDLGVVRAQRRQYAQAVEHFQASIRHDPGYQKAYHNLAMVYYLTGRNEQALDSVDRALALRPAARDSLMLKGVVLRALGREEQAAAYLDEAEFLPEGNWSEQLSIQRP